MNMWLIRSGPSNFFFVPVFFLETVKENKQATIDETSERESECFHKVFPVTEYCKNIAF